MKKISRLLLVVTLVLGTILAATLSAQAAWSGTVATSFYSGIRMVFAPKVNWHTLQNRW